MRPSIVGRRAQQPQATFGGVDRGERPGRAGWALNDTPGSLTILRAFGQGIVYTLGLLIVLPLLGVVFFGRAAVVLVKLVLGRSTDDFELRDA